MTRCESYPPCFGTIYFPTAPLSKFSYFVVCDACSETLAYLLKCNCLQLYFHVGMGT